MILDDWVLIRKNITLCNSEMIQAKCDHDS